MDVETPTYVLDSFALLAYLQNEAGAAQVEQILNLASKRQATLALGVVNLAEALYITERARGLLKAQETVATVDELPISIIEVNRTLAFSAAHLKANHALSLADAFAAALAKEKKARLVTGDPEFASLQTEIPIDWLPRKK